jgi:hypothetical protein
VCVNGTEYISKSGSKTCRKPPCETGTRVLLNEAFAVTDVFGFEKNNGPSFGLPRC